MKSSGLLWGAFILLSGIVTISGYYIYYEFKRLNDDISKSVLLRHEPPSQVILSENDIVAIIDERLASIKKQKTKKRLSSLKRQYHLASVDNSENKLLYGNDRARFTLQEFADIECPYCRKMHAEIKRVSDHSEGVINWEFKHFPLSSNNPAAAIAAQTIECINEAYSNRVAWVAIDQFIAETRGNGKGINDMVSFLRSFGLNGSLISNCLASDDHKNKINNDYKDGRNAGITATPAVRILDNQTGKQYLLKGYKTSEMILQAIQKMVNH